MSKPKPAPLPAGTVVGGYQVIKKLAAGGFGVVYLCEDSERKLQFDLYYIKNLSLALDLYIIFSTIKTVVLRRGA